ncbi:MAG: zinc ribbon domain-containing protein [Ruminococcus sp.]|nr:zinc ribbon domain-containing protein [Ruminococcus sp.]
MFCGKCGAEIAQGTKFCSKCGASVEESTVNTAAQTGGSLINKVIKHDYKYYTASAIGLLSIIISLFPLLINRSEEIPNGNIFAFFSYMSKSHGTILFYGFLFSLGCAAMLIVGIIGIIKIVKGLINVNKKYLVSVDSTTSGLIFMGIVGILAILTGFVFNIFTISASASKYGVSQKELDAAMDLISFKISIFAVLLAIVGIGGAKLAEKVTYPFVKQARAEMLANLPSSKDQNIKPGDWKCENCGKINDEKHKSCTCCYHKREE